MCAITFIVGIGLGALGATAYIVWSFVRAV
jgi:hypothetical protein